MAENLCELCGSRGLKSKLVTRQLNFDEAIIVCENDECVYPLVDLSQVCNNVVKRKASDAPINLKVKRKKRKKVQKTKPEDSSREEILMAECASVHEMILQWQNRGALCWLDCTMALLVHNGTLARCLFKPRQQTDGIVKVLVDSWSKAQTLTSKNSKDVAAAPILDEVRDQVWQYLKPIMKCEVGLNDSPVAALLLLLKENSAVEEEFLQYYQWEFNCGVCGYKQIDRNKKCIVTFPNTTSDFSLPNNLFFSRSCYKCGVPGQRSVMVYHKQPSCIMLHFLEGLKTGECLETGFQLGSDHYAVSHLIQYQHNPDHFIFWTKEPNGERWMEMDDTKPSVCTWSANKPSVPPTQVHVAVWEKVFDKNQIRHKSVPVDVPEPWECVLSVNTDSEAQLKQKRRVSRPPPLDMTGMVEELTTGNLGDFNHDTMTSEDPKNYVNTLPLLSVTRDSPTHMSAPVYHSGLVNDSSHKVLSNTASDTPIVTNNLLQFSSRSTTTLDNLPAWRSAYALQENSNLHLKKSLDTLKHSFVLDNSNLTSSVSKLIAGSAPTLPVTNGTSVPLRSSSFACAPVTRNESCAVKCRQTYGTIKSASNPSNPSTTVLAPHLTRSVSDTSILSHVTRTNSKTTSHGAFLLKRKLTAAEFEPYIPGKQKCEQVNGPNSPLVAATTAKDLNICKAGGNLPLNGLGHNSKKAAFLSWQEVAEYNRKDILAYDSQSDSGYSSPASVSSCSSLAALSDCGVVDIQTSELHSSSASLSINPIHQQGVSENKCQSECAKLVSELEELLIDCFDCTSTSAEVTDAPVGGTVRLPIDVSDGNKQLSQEDDDFLLELVCS